MNKCQNKCNELQKDLLFLNNGLKYVDVNCRNAFNEYNQIGLTKFVENEVEETQIKKSNTSNENKSNKTKEERDKVLMESFNNSIRKSMNSFKTQNKKRKIKLPSIIGTEDFFMKEYFTMDDDEEEKEPIIEVKKEKSIKIENKPKEEEKVIIDNTLPSNIFIGKKSNLFEDFVDKEKKSEIKEIKEEKSKEEINNTKQKVQFDHIFKKGLFDIDDDEEIDILPLKEEKPTISEVVKEEKIPVIKEVKEEKAQIQSTVKKTYVEHKLEKAKNQLFKMFEEDDEENELELQKEKELLAKKEEKPIIATTIAELPPANPDEIKSKTQSFQMKLNNLFTEKKQDNNTKKDISIKLPTFLHDSSEEDESFIPVKEDNYNELPQKENIDLLKNQLKAKLSIQEKQSSLDNKPIEKIVSIKEKAPLPIVKKKKPKKPIFSPNTLKQQQKSNNSTINIKGGVKKTIISFDAPPETKPKSKPINKKAEAKKEKPIKPVKFTFKFDDDD